ncbi:MAG: CDGSH iron-sulfur domain-containing protein [Bacteroidales bacterium]
MADNNTDEGRQDTAIENAPAASIRILKNGPAVIRGNFTITGAEGEPLSLDRPIASICRCGSSKKKPFCDGSHIKSGFTD